jgi:hypothetical protein
LVEAVRKINGGGERKKERKKTLADVLPTPTPSHK